MSTATTSKVRTALVIGGGIAGPVVATALLKAGIQATVYEEPPPWPKESAAAWPWPPTAWPHSA